MRLDNLNHNNSDYACVGRQVFNYEAYLNSDDLDRVKELIGNCDRFEVIPEKESLDFSKIEKVCGESHDVVNFRQPMNLAGPLRKVIVGGIPVVLYNDPKFGLYWVSKGGHLSSILRGGKLA